MSRIKITRGGVTDAEVNHQHLVSNHLLDPTKNIDRVLMYAEQRQLMTLLTSGATDSRYTASGFTPKGGDSIQTKIKQIPKGEMVSSKGWSFRIMGRIQKAVEVIGTAAVGTPTAGTNNRGGFFKLNLKDNYISMGMVVTFPSGNQARVQELPVGHEGKVLYSFQCFPGETFDWDTWVGVMPGTKTVFGGYTSVGERSRRGFGNFHYPDRYIQHTTTQRKTIDISGDVEAETVIWYELNGEKGFSYEAEAQSRAQFLLEDEFQKWWGKSTMRDPYGNLLAAPAMKDEKGDDVVAGDGWVEQIRGANDHYNSGSTGKATYDDLADMMKELKKKSNYLSGNVFYGVTGVDGMANAADVLATKYGTPTIVHLANKGNNKVGGYEIPVGYNFQVMNVNGDQVIFVENPMMDDESKFPKRLSNGELAMSNTYYFMNNGQDGKGRSNVEIRVRGRAGVNRNLVYLWKNGMTGKGVPTDPVDATAFHMLKENLLVVYLTVANGILSPVATA